MMKLFEEALAQFEEALGRLIIVDKLPDDYQERVALYQRKRQALLDYVSALEKLEKVPDARIEAELRKNTRLSLNELMDMIQRCPVIARIDKET